MKRYEYPDLGLWPEILARPVFDDLELEEKVIPVLRDIKSRGDNALLEYTERFDGVKLDTLEVQESEFEEAISLVDDSLIEAINVAKRNIEKFHASQVAEVEPVETTSGVLCWRESRPIEKVGLYIPGGTAPLFSTILMLAIPAKIAGCEEIVLCTPPNKDGKVHPAILFTAHLLGVTKVIKAGGAQAIAALAYGTETVPQVYKIFGPGNQFVTAAKQMVTRSGVAIDMPAGPSEVAVIADEEANAAFIASDLLSQAEHGVDSQALFITTSLEKAVEVEEEVAKQVALLPRKELALKALEHSKIVVLKSEDDIVLFTNAYAPEHLIIQTKHYHDYIPKIINAGSVFLGAFTPEAAGDYASGTNHTLPTNGYATAYSGVSLDSFLKKVTFQEISARGIKELGPFIEIMAAEEELQAHKNAVTLRLKSL